MPSIKMISPHKQKEFTEHCYYEVVQVKNGECFIPETFYQNKTIETLQKRGYIVYQEPVIPEVRPSPIEIIKHGLELENTVSKPMEKEMMKIPIEIAPDQIEIRAMNQFDIMKESILKPKKTYKIEEHNSDDRLTKPVKKRGRPSKKEVQVETEKILKNKKCRATGCRRWAMSGSEFCYKHSQQEVKDLKMHNYPNLSPDEDL